MSIATFPISAGGGDVGWHSVDLLSFNGGPVRHRTMAEVEAQWHSHSQSDELFFFLSGELEMDVRAKDGDAQTYVFRPGQMMMVHAGYEHRARSCGISSMIVMDAIAGG
ncbi:MAG: cupin domain-containing protein [Sphingobium sp.]|nr:cupin domain-containing protein [Sphingobium sp.]